MKKFSVYLLTICMLLVLTACKGESSKEELLEKSDYLEIDESIEYASIVEVTINPAFRFYLDENQNVIKVESLNDDAQAVCENLDLSDKSFDECLSSVLEESISQGFLTDEKTVNVSVVRNNMDVYAPDIIQNTAGIVEDITSGHDLKSDCSIVISDEIVEEQADSWNEEDYAIYVVIDEEADNDEDTDDGNGNICEACGGDGYVICDLCNGTGKMIEYEEHEVEVRNDYVCPYCGGVGILDDGLHGGETAVCGHCGGEGKTGPMSGDFKELAYDIEIVSEEVEKDCSRCGGSGTITCTRCDGTGNDN